MSKLTIKLNGDNFSDLESFYYEIDKLLTKDLSWQTGHNLNAFNDLLRGGFGVYEYEEPVELIWTNFSNSTKILGQNIIETLVEIIKNHGHIEFTINN